MSTSSMPMYEQIQHELMEQIQSGLFQPGDRIPSEKELAERYHVSRITAVKALTELALNGYIYRVQGRGSFANPLDKHLKPSALKLANPPKLSDEPCPVTVLIPEHADYHSGSIIQGITQTLCFPECFVRLVLTHTNQLEEYALEQAAEKRVRGRDPLSCGLRGVQRHHFADAPEQVPAGVDRPLFSGHSEQLRLLRQ